MRYVFLGLMVVFAGIYAVIKKDEGLLSKTFFKSAASVMFVLVAVSVRTGVFRPYYILILIALCLSLVGDVLMVFTEVADKHLVGGASFFLFAHVFYIAGFSIYSGLLLIDVVIFVGLILIGAIVFYGRTDHLGKLKIPAYIYAAVLCAMVTKAVSMLFLTDVNYIYAIFAAVGGILFGLSDLVLGLGIFYPKAKTTLGVLNTVMYYGGQALIALSVMM